MGTLTGSGATDGPPDPTGLPIRASSRARKVSSSEAAMEGQVLRVPAASDVVGHASMVTGRGRSPMPVRRGIRPEASLTFLMGEGTEKLHHVIVADGQNGT